MAIAGTGATPVFIDVDPPTYTVALEQLASAFSPNGGQIMPCRTVPLFDGFGGERYNLLDSSPSRRLSCPFTSTSVKNAGER
ncbi:MAG: DegT/DnrJ/EryC1/StrS family aminotransferase [Terriglobia bacterium]